MEYELYPLGDSAVILEFGTEITPRIQNKVQLVSSFLEKNPPRWMIEFIPAFTTVTILYNPNSFKNKELPYEVVSTEVRNILSKIESTDRIEHRLVEIPVCYGGELGPDLEYVANYNNLTPAEVIQIHTSEDYLVYMIGFAPGFPYIGGMSEKIATPRKASPRLKIPARSVGIAGMQTGIYPIETPGGWQLIGRTPIELFQPNAHPPSLLKAGDKIRFFQISQEEYEKWEKEKS